MTPSDIMGLSDLELNPEIAQVDGWSNVCLYLGRWEGYPPSPHTGGPFVVPKYSNDLNAIAPVEKKVIAEVGMGVYYDKIVAAHLWGRSFCDCTVKETLSVVTADARTRCRACLLALVKEEGIEAQ